MSPETIFNVHLVLGYVVWVLCFGVYIWPRLKAMDRIEAQRDHLEQPGGGRLQRGCGRIGDAGAQFLARGPQLRRVDSLRGRGLPRVNASGVGDLHVRVQLWTPDSVTRDEETLLRKLAETHKAPESREKGFWTRMREALGA